MINNNSKLAKRIIKRIVKNIWVRLLSLNSKKQTEKRASNKPLLLLANTNEKRAYIKIKKREKKNKMKETLKNKTLNVEFGGKFNTR